MLSHPAAFPLFRDFKALLTSAMKEWLDRIEECKKNFKLKLEREVNEGDIEVTSEETSSSSENANPFLEETGKNPFLDDDKNLFPDDDDSKNPFKENNSTNPFDDDEDQPIASSSPASRSSKLVKVGKGWLRDLPEDLDMFIAQRDFERAMELIDRSE
ncbi:Exocyst complex component 8 [Desmophyllum pertusum]|uniref:Exocyst complex component 8 n=1 Tax=Desmophyllum pertusum TaxID=174260 RepID=A0A9W9YK83_9CNID|nr:Exocyst complex component 8 [Desmophyllum pertusum]